MQKTSAKKRCFAKKVPVKFVYFEKTVYFCTRIRQSRVGAKQKGSGFSAVGSAHVWGARGRWFESSNPDQERKRLRIKRFLVFFVFIGFLEVTLGDVVGDSQSQPRSQTRFMQKLLKSLIFPKIIAGISKTILNFANDMRRNLYIIAGCNGAGTWADRLSYQCA